jgi:hypothetical protein
MTHSTLIWALYLQIYVKWEAVGKKQDSILHEQVRVVRNNLSVISMKCSDVVCTTVVGMHIDQISLSSHYSDWLKWFWKYFRAFSVMYAWYTWKHVATWTMDHAAFHYVEEIWFTLRIWPRHSDEGVNICCCWRCVVREERKKEVHVWKASLLKFDGMDLSMYVSKDVPVSDVV